MRSWGEIQLRSEALIAHSCGAPARLSSNCGLHRFTRRDAAGPRPLEIIAAKPAGYVNRFADHEQARDTLGGHGLRTELGGRDAPARHFRLGIALAPVGRELPSAQSALGRIEDGTYGLCTVCGRPIGEERLEAVPYATLCIDDKRALERT